MTQLNQAIAGKLHTVGLPLNPALVNKISAQAAQRIEAVWKDAGVSEMGNSLKK